MNSVSASPIVAALAACANRQQPTKSNCHTIENETNEQEPQSTSTSTPHLPTINTAPTITTPSDTSHNTGTENVSTSKKRESQRHHHLTLAVKRKLWDGWLKKLNAVVLQNESRQNLSPNTHSISNQDTPQTTWEQNGYGKTAKASLYKCKGAQGQKIWDPFQLSQKAARKGYL